MDSARKLQALELSFFDHQQTGQLMSRATVDLQAVRFFLGYGLIFIAQSILTIALAAAVMLAIQPELAALSLLPVPFVVLISYRYGRRARPAIQETQQRIAELTADAEENISGVRVVKAFAREAHQRARFERSVTRVFQQSMLEARLQTRYNPLIGFLPQLGMAAVLLVGGYQVIHHQLNIGQFSAFYLYLLMLLSPMQTLGVSLTMAQRATASGARIFQILDREPAMTVPAGAPGLPAGDGHVALRHEDAVKAAFAGIAVEFASDVFGDFARGEAKFRNVFVAVIDLTHATAHRRDGEGFTRQRRADLQRPKIGAVAGRPFFRGDVYDCGGFGFHCYSHGGDQPFWEC